MWNISATEKNSKSPRELQYTVVAWKCLSFVSWIRKEKKNHLGKGHHPGSLEDCRKQREGLLCGWHPGEPPGCPDQL